MEINYKKVGYKICEVLYWALFALLVFGIFERLLVDSMFETLVEGEGKTEGIFHRAMLCGTILSTYLSLAFKNKMISLIILFAFPISDYFFTKLILFINS